MARKIFLGSLTALVAVLAVGGWSGTTWVKAGGPHRAHRCAGAGCETCVANPHFYGFYPTQWRKWPGVVTGPSRPEPRVPVGLPPAELPSPETETDLVPGLPAAPPIPETLDLEENDAPPAGVIPDAEPPLLEPGQDLKTLDFGPAEKDEVDEPGWQPARTPRAKPVARLEQTLAIEEQEVPSLPTHVHGTEKQRMLALAAFTDSYRYRSPLAPSVHLVPAEPLRETPQATGSPASQNTQWALHVEATESTSAASQAPAAHWRANPLRGKARTAR